MSSLVLLVGLVSVAFAVSALLGRRGHYGLLSGSEYLFFGALIGPVLGIVDSDSAGLIRTMVLLSASWMGISLGLRLPAALRQLRPAEMASLVIEVAVVVAVVYFGLGLLVRFDAVTVPLPPALRVGLGLLAAPTTKASWAWARRQLGASGPTTDFLSRVAETDDLLPVLGLLVLTTLFQRPEQLLRGYTIAGLTIGLALVGALSFTALAGRRPHENHAWVALIGVLLLGTGVSSRLGLPALTVSALCGMMMTLFSEDPATIQEKMTGPTERPVVLVLLMAIGTQLEPSRALIAPLAAVVVLRVVGKLLAGAVMAPLGARTAGSGLGLLGFGGVAAALAAQLALVFPGSAKLLFAVAALLALFGDVSSALGLRLLLGPREVDEPDQSDETAVPAKKAEVA